MKDEICKDYDNLSIDTKIIKNFRGISHSIMHNSEGKGSQSRILIILLENKEVSQRALTKHLGIQPGSVSEVLKKLEDNGLINRLASEDDRRTSILSLTAEGEEAAKKALSHKDQLYNEMLEVLDEKYKQELLALLEKLNDDWDHKYHHKHKHKKKKGE